MNVEARLAKLGLALPKPTKPVGNYQPWILSGNLLYLSGQFIQIQDGKLIYTGRVGAERTEADGYASGAAGLFDVLAQIHAATLAASTAGNTASRRGAYRQRARLEQCAESVGRRIGLVSTVLRECGRHTRTAFTPPLLPLNSTLELS